MVAGAAELELRPLQPTKLGRAGWNAFVSEFGETVQSTYEKLSILSLKYRSVRTFGIYISGALVGYFTVVRKAGACRFYNGVNLYPEHECRWPEVMGLALSHLGSGKFVYGWRWSVRGSRAADITALGNVELVQSINYCIQGVDLAQWRSWQDYYKNISNNIRRNSRQTVADYPDVVIRFRRGYAALPSIARLVSYKRQLCSKKRIPFNSVKAFAGYSIRLLLTPNKFMLAEAVSGKKVLSIVRLAVENDTTYYFEGASHPEYNASSLLQTTVLKELYEREPRSKYIMGWRYKEGPADPDLIRSRNALRVSEWETSEIAFTYAQGDRLSLNG